jgi:YD repeat-containing protein
LVSLKAGDAGASITQTVTTGAASVNLRPTVYRTVDRWGNVLSISDPRAMSTNPNSQWVTQYRYNTHDQIVQVTQPDSSGIIQQTTSPITKIFYDKVGHQVAVWTALTGQDWQRFDAGGQLVAQGHNALGIDAHGLTNMAIGYNYDLYGNKIQMTDATGQSTQYVYDKLGRLTQTTLIEDPNVWGQPSWNRVWQTAFTYDELGHKLSETRGKGSYTPYQQDAIYYAGETTRYRYDLNGNVVETILPLGQKTKYAYDSMNRKIAEVDANGNRETWEYDYFGLLTGHTDFGDHVYSYFYDNARQLTKRTSAVSLFPILQWATVEDTDFGYDRAGQLIRQRANDSGQTYTAAYDIGGKRVREKTVLADGTVAQDSRISYERHG